MVLCDFLDSVVFLLSSLLSSSYLDLNLNIFYFLYFPTLHFLELAETFSAFPLPEKKKKRNTKFLSLFFLYKVPRLLLDKAPRPQARDRLRMRPSRTWTSARLSQHPGSLDPAYLHELGATLSTQSTVGSRSLSQSLDHTCLLSLLLLF